MAVTIIISFFQSPVSFWTKAYYQLTANQNVQPSFAKQTEKTYVQQCKFYFNLPMKSMYSASPYPGFSYT